MVGCGVATGLLCLLSAPLVCDLKWVTIETHHWNLGIDMNSKTNPKVLERIQRNPYCMARNTESMDVLELLLRHEDADVRLAATCNPLITPKMLTVLATDRDNFVRYAVAAHPLTPTKILDVLTKDKEPIVRRGVLENAHAKPGKRSISFVHRSR